MLSEPSVVDELVTTRYCTEPLFCKSIDVAMKHKYNVGIEH